MKGIGYIAPIAAVVMLVVASPAGLAQEISSDPMYLAFQRIVDDLNDNKMSSFVRAVDDKAMLGTIYAQRLIDSRVRTQFTDGFAAEIESMFVSSFPKAEGDILGRIVAFERQGDRATAVVRFDLSPYQYIYHEFDLQKGKGDGVRIVDWVNFYWGTRFTESMGDALVMVMPGETQTRSLLSPVELSDAEAFQVAELLKAIRDQEADRYFEILPGLDPRIQVQEMVTVTSVHLAQRARNKEQYRAALTRLAENYAGDPRYTVMLLDYYLPRREFQRGLEALLRLKSRLGTEDAAILAQLATLELIVGNVEQAGSHAEEAVAAEPGSELAWWAALRTRTARQDYEAAVQALTVLEREFGHQLRGKALGRDAGLAKLLETDQYQSWRDAENP